MAHQDEQMNRRRRERELRRKKQLAQQRKLRQRLLLAAAALVVCGVAIFAINGPILPILPPRPLWLWSSPRQPPGSSGIPLR